MPSLHELINGEMNLNRLRNIRIEDLLGREPVSTEMGNVSAYITGGNRSLLPARGQHRRGALPPGGGSGSFIDHYSGP